MTTYAANTKIHNGIYPLNSSTVSITSGKTAGSVLASNGISASWTQPSTHFNSSNQKPVMTIPHGEEKVVIEKEAALEVKGSVVINGVDLEERLKTIEQVLQIPERDVKLEAKHPKLKELYDAYINALARYRTWDTLKDSK